MKDSGITRRNLLVSATACALAAPSVILAQSSKPKTGANTLSVAQIVDTSPEQQDVSRDFLVGSRAAWQTINTHGGVKSRLIQHITIEVDGSEASIRSAIESIRNLPSCVALTGTAGERAAIALVRSLRRETFEIAHVAPWLQNSDQEVDSSTFPIFASRQEQILHAIKSLVNMSVTDVGVVYASQQEQNLYRSDVEQTATQLKIKLQSYSPTSNLKQIAQSLPPTAPAILLFVGGTPELMQFTQGIEKQAKQRYVIALADVNPQTLLQMGVARNTPVITTQIVPLVNAGLPIVRSYREALARLFDEPPTPLSLAGFIAARYTYEILNTIDAQITRQSVLQTFQKRAPIDLGGYRIKFNAQHRSGTFVTQSMLTPDGRLVG
jgi:ABC-type branched-subunit amino acid transport system substrate-binding protein